jgi:hypothetical protein
MIVLNAGVPRSGTVLVNAILRELFKGANVPTGQANPHGPDLPRVIRHLQQTGQDRHRTVLVHTHSWDGETASLLSGSPHVVAFLNYRDPRDVCVSLMRLHDHDFDTAAQMTEGSFQLFDACAASIEPMVIPYELLAADKPGHIFQIARRLGFWPGMDRVSEIDEATSIDRHRAVMEKVQAGEIDKLARRRNSKRVLVEDPATLINDRHIQSGVAGRWRTELEKDQQARASERFAPLLKRFGYPE